VVEAGPKQRVLQAPLHPYTRALHAAVPRLNAPVAADVCILPYKSATQSGITSISNHYDLPIIATNVGGLKETIHHLKTGIIVEQPEINQIATAIITYFTNGYQKEFSKEIKNEKAENSWENFCKKIIEFSKTL
ncbi:MAG: glycosyltransferase, partial [Crocinitomicaceae bacterium]|nr:glycosyltransferase [Crocinitomicaceae bacterium]